MSLIHLEPRALELAEKFGSKTSDPVRSPAAAFDRTLSVLDRMISDAQSPEFRACYIAGTDISCASHMVTPTGHLSSFVDSEVRIDMKSGFNRLSSRMGGWGQSVVVDLTQQQEDILLRLQGFMGASVPSVRSPAQAYSVGVRYLMGVAALLYGDIATPHDCALKDGVDVRVTPRKLYASLPDGGYAERRIRGLNF